MLLFLTHLWLPILVSAVFVFIVSSVLHVALPWHKSDYKKMSNEDAVLDAMRAADVSVGCFMFPFCESMKDWDSPEMKAKREKGPLGIITTVGPDGFNMGKSLVLWFGQSLLIALLVAYMAWPALGAGVGFGSAFHATGIAAFLGYSIGHLHNSIWRGESWFTTGKFLLDGLLYALVTAVTFGWLWPKVA